MDSDDVRGESFVRRISSLEEEEDVIE